MVILEYSKGDHRANRTYTLPSHFLASAIFLQVSWCPSYFHSGNPAKKYMYVPDAVQVQVVSSMCCSADLCVCSNSNTRETSALLSRLLNSTHLQSIYQGCARLTAYGLHSQYTRIQNVVI